MEEKQYLDITGLEVFKQKLLEQVEALDVESLKEALKKYKTGTEVTQEIRAAIDALVNGATDAMDTLGELEEAITGNKGIIDTLNSAITKKADKATTLAGYGIEDAKIEGGVITLGDNTITPLTKHQDLSEYVKNSEIGSIPTSEIEDLFNEE